ncbi:MAG: type IV pilus biogenesis/stability protein PilW [Pseudohongiellaceae bacterium]
MARYAAFLPLLLSASLLGACVTSTQGGFNVRSSQERALQDYIELAAGYYAADDLVSAKRHVDNALAIDRRSAEAHNVRALIHQREGEHELARDTFEYAIRQDPSNSRVRNNFAAFLYEREEYQAAYEQLQVVADDTEYRSRPQAFQNLGLAAVAAGHREEAREAFRRALDLDRTLQRSSLRLAELHFEDGNFGQAREYYEQFRVSSQFNDVSQSARSLWLGIRLEWRFDNRAAARDYARQLEEMYPDTEQYRMYLQQRDERR